jgi:hypothetical protein
MHKPPSFSTNGLQKMRKLNMLCSKDGSGSPKHLGRRLAQHFGGFSKTQKGFHSSRLPKYEGVKEIFELSRKEIKI